VAAGRRPVTGYLGLEAAGVRLDDRGCIATDRHLATTARGIYAAGDVTGRMPFTHAAFAMGRLAARNALRRRWSPPGAFATSAIPWVVFTDPEVAQVGLAEAQAAPHRGARVAYLPMREADRAVTAGRTEGFIKIIAGPRRVLGNTGGGRVLGATVVAARAGEMIHEPALAMRTGMFHRPARPDRPCLPHLVAGHPAGRRPAFRPVRRPHRPQCKVLTYNLVAGLDRRRRRAVPL
jgi:pyruvate/2-oxoglutarate dehydrogenase complex dihydrolipoamide dehydrogenase (E3) component